MGSVLDQQGDLTAALASGERALELSPDQPDVLTNLAITLRALGRLEFAEAMARRATRLRPEMASLHANLGNLLIDLRRFDEATARDLARRNSRRASSSAYSVRQSPRLSGTSKAR